MYPRSHFVNFKKAAFLYFFSLVANHDMKAFWIVQILI